MSRQYQIIDMDNGNCAYDRLTLTEAMDKLDDGNYALMPMSHEDDNYTVRCSFCKRQGFEPADEDTLPARFNLQSKNTGQIFYVDRGEMRQCEDES